MNTPDYPRCGNCKYFIIGQDTPRTGVSDVVGRLNDLMVIEDIKRGFTGLRGDCDVFNQHEQPNRIGWREVDNLIHGRQDRYGNFPCSFYYRTTDQPTYKPA